MGVARQYCGRLGKVANVPGLCQPVGTGIWTCICTRVGPRTKTGVRPGLPEDRQGYRSKTELALEMVGRAQERGHLKAGWVVADDAFGMSPSWTFRIIRASPQTQAETVTMEQRSDELPEEAWRATQPAPRVRPTSRRKPGEIHWAVYRRNRDGSEPRYYLSNAPEDTRVGDPHTWEAPVGVSGEKRRRPETTRTWAAGHVALCLLGGVFAPATGLGGKRCPGSRGRRSTGWCGKCCPRFGPTELLRWLEDKRTGQTLRQAPRRHAGITPHPSLN